MSIRRSDVTRIFGKKVMSQHTPLRHRPPLSRSPIRSGDESTITSLYTHNARGSTLS